MDHVRLTKYEFDYLGGDPNESTTYPAPVDPKEDVADLHGVALQEEGTDHDEVTVIVRDGGKMLFKDGENPTPLSLSEIAAGTAGLTEASHEILRSVTHDVVENSFEEYLYSAGMVTNCTVWETVAKLKKVREEQYTYDAGKISQVVTIQYDTSGVEKYRITEVYTYSAGKISNVTRTRT